jgi:hypothetical protein
VRVIAFGKPPCRSGVATVEATFEQIRWRVRVSDSYDEITARSVTCPSDGVDAPKEK